MTECPDPWLSMTCFPVVTGLLVVSNRVTVILTESMPSAAAEVDDAATVGLLGEVEVTGGGEPSPGWRLLSVPSVLTSNGAEKRCGSVKAEVPELGLATKIPS